VSIVCVSFNNSLSPNYSSQSSSAFQHEKCEDTEEVAKEPVTVRGAYESLIYLRHLRIRELKVKLMKDVKGLRDIGLFYTFFFL